MPIPAPAQSYGQRLTARHSAAIARGIHPLTGIGLANNGKTCGDCVHAFAYRRYWKCDTRPITSGAATDIRVGWPACKAFEAGKKGD